MVSRITDFAAESRRIPSLIYALRYNTSDLQPNFTADVWKSLDHPQPDSYTTVGSCPFHVVESSRTVASSFHHRLRSWLGDWSARRHGICICGRDRDMTSVEWLSRAGATHKPVLIGRRPVVMGISICFRIGSTSELTIDSIWTL